MITQRSIGAIMLHISERAGRLDAILSGGHVDLMQEGRETMTRPNP